MIGSDSLRHVYELGEVNMRSITIVILLVFSSFCCWAEELQQYDAVAEESKEYRVCMERATNQILALLCAAQEEDSLNAGIDMRYRQLLSRAANQPNAAVKIKNLRKAWVAYRDAYVEAMFPEYDESSQYRAGPRRETDLLRVKLDQQHIKALDELSEQSTTLHK